LTIFVTVSKSDPIDICDNRNGNHCESSVPGRKRAVRTFLGH